jgi:drug/metabolite transporter (DMT)-like permease
VIIFSGELIITERSVWGGLVLLSGAASAACAMVIGRKHSRFVDPTANVVVQVGVGACLLVASARILEPAIPTGINLASLVALFFMAVVASAFGYAALYWLFRCMEATRVSLVTFISPVIAVLLGTSMLGEKVGPNVLGGGSLILVGVILVNRASKTQRLVPRLRLRFAPRTDHEAYGEASNEGEGRC